LTKIEAKDPPHYQ